MDIHKLLLGVTGGYVVHLPRTVKPNRTVNVTVLALTSQIQRE